MVRDPIRRRTSFGRWVTRYQVPRLVQTINARGIPLTSHTVYDWIAGRHAPRPPYAAAIVEISGGRVSFSDIYRHRTEMQAVSSGQRRAGGERPLD